MSIKAYVTCKKTNFWFNTPSLFNDKKKLKQLILDNAIVVYPEWMDNVLYSKAPVVWMLALYDRVIEKAYAFHPDMYPNLPALTVPIYNTRLFNMKGAGKRSGFAFYKGKAYLTSQEQCNRADEVFSQPGGIEITRFYPRSRRKLARILKSVKYFYTIDPATALSTEARLCGCPVVYLGAKMPIQIRETYNSNGMAFNGTKEEIWRAGVTLKDFKIDESNDWEKTVFNFVRDTYGYYINGEKEYA